MIMSCMYTASYWFLLIAKDFFFMTVLIFYKEQEILLKLSPVSNKDAYLTWTLYIKPFLKKTDEQNFLNY